MEAVQVAGSPRNAHDPANIMNDKCDLLLDVQRCQKRIDKSDLRVDGIIKAVRQGKGLSLAAISWKVGARQRKSLFKIWMMGFRSIRVIGIAMEQQQYGAFAFIDGPDFYAIWKVDNNFMHISPGYALSNYYYNAM